MGSSRIRDRTWPPALASGFWATREALLGVFSSFTRCKFFPFENICLECSSCPSWHLSLTAQLKFHVFIRTFLKHPPVSIWMTWPASIMTIFLFYLSSQGEGKLHENSILFVLFSTKSPMAQQWLFSRDLLSEWENHSDQSVSACFTFKPRWWRSYFLH